MLSILTPEYRVPDLSTVNETSQDELEETPVAEAGDFEIVLGRLQVASVLFLATVVLVIFSAVFYFAGKASTPKPAPAPAAAVTIQPQTIQPDTTIVQDAPEKKVPAKPPLPIFDEPRKGAVYLQMGAVDEGIAALLVEGLRSRGFQSFAAPGPNEKIFRVLIGPLPDAETYSLAREAVNRIGLITFVRKYEP